MWDALRRRISGYISEAADVCERALPEEDAGTEPAGQTAAPATSKQAEAEDAADSDAEQAQGPALCMLLGSNQDGKTSLINMLLSISMETPEGYMEHAQRQYGSSSGAPKSDKLEAVDRLKKLKGDTQMEGTAGAKLCTMPSPQQRPRLIQLVDRRAEVVRRCIEEVREYKLFSPDFEATASLLETGGDATACTEHPVVVAHGATPQLLVCFKSTQDVESILVEHLRVVSSRDLADAVEVSEVDQEYLAKVWSALTLSTANLATEQAAFCRDEKDYMPPLKPWVRQLLGRDFIHLGRAAGQEADLYRELAFLLELLKLHVAVDKLAAKKQQELLAWLAEVDSEGPWGELQGGNAKALCGELKGLMLLLQRVQLFVPARLMKLLGVELVDAPGTNDSSTMRKVLQRRLEEEVDNVVILTPRTLNANEAVLNHLAGSPFLENYVMERLAGADLSTSSHHHLSIMLYAEKEGLALPRPNEADDSDDEDQERQDIKGLTRHIDALYLARLPRHISSTLGARVATIKGEDLPRVFSKFAKAQDDALSMPSRAIELLARQPPVFYSLPMLGIALELQLGDQAAMQRLLGRRVQLEQLQAATATAQHTHFLAALLQPQLETAAAAIKDATQVVVRVRRQVERLARPVKILDQLTAAQQAAIAGQARTRMSTSTLESKFGAMSPPTDAFTKTFVKPLQDWPKLAVAALLDADDVWDPLASGVVESVVEKLSAEYNLSTPPLSTSAGLPQLSASKAKPPKVRQLLHELAPAYMWLHPKAPLSRWITRAARTALEPLLEGLRERLLEKLQPQVVKATQVILQQEFISWVELKLGVGSLSREDIEQLVAPVLMERMNLREWVEGAFRKSFFRNYTREHAYMTPYKKHMLAVLDRVVCSNVSVREGVHKELIKAAAAGAATSLDTTSRNSASKPSSSSSNASSSSIPDMATGIKKVLRTQLALLMQEYYKKLRTELVSTLDGHFLDLRSRVYEGYQYRISKARPSNNIFIPAAKMFWPLLQQTLTDGKASEYRAALARLTEVQQQLNRLMEPGELGQLMAQQDPQLGPMVAPALHLARQWLLNQSCWGGAGTRIQLPKQPCTPPAAAAAVAAAQTGAASTRAAPAVAAAEQAPWQAASHTATSEQMQAMVTHLQEEGLQLQEAGGGGQYNCWLHSVLVQLMGLAPDQVPAAAQLFREMAAVCLERELAAEAAAAAVQGAPGPLTVSIAAYHGVDLEGGDAAVHQALADHLQGLRNGAMLTDVDQAVLARIIDELYSASIVLYSPCYSSRGFCTTYSTATPAEAGEGEAAGLVIRIANVWPQWVEDWQEGALREGQGELNHFVMVVPAEPSQGSLAGLDTSAAAGAAAEAAAGVGNGATASAVKGAAGVSNGGSSSRGPPPPGSARKRPAAALAEAPAAGSAAKQRRTAVVLELSGS